MANNAGAPPQQLMYYYVAVQNPQASQGYGQGGDGMNHQDFSQGQPGGMPEFQQQPAYFMAAPQDASNMGAVGMQMGHMPVMQGQPGQQGVMMPGSGQMVMLMTPGQGQMQGQMMPNQMAQQNQMQGQMGQGQSPPQQQQQQQMEPPVQDNQQGGAGGWGGPGMTPKQSHDNSQVPGRTPTGSKAFKIVDPRTNEEVTNKGHDTSPQQGQMQHSGQQGQMQHSGQLQASAMPWQQDVRQAPQQPQSMQPQQSQQPQTFVPAGGQTGPDPQSQPPAPATASKVRKGLQNKKIEKAKDGEGETPTASAPTPTPQAVPPKALSPMPPSRNFNSTEATTASAKSSTGPAPSESKAIPRWPPNHSAGGGPSSSFASSIKALNLEPMRANPAPYSRTKPAVRAAPEPLPGPPAPQNQNQNQAPQASQAPPPKQQQPPQQPQTQQPPPQPQQMQPQMQTQMPPDYSMQMKGVVQMMPQMAVNSGPWGQLQPQQPQQQAQPSPAPSPTPAGTAPVQKTVKKLKNAVLARPKPKNADGEEEERNEDERESAKKPEESSPAQTKIEKTIGMSDEVCPSCGSYFAEDAIFCRKCGTKRPSKIEARKAPAASASKDLRPKDGIFDRALMLRIWRADKDVKHPKVQDLHTSAKGAMTPNSKNKTPGSASGSMFSRRPQAPALKPTDKGWQRREPTNREQEIERQVRSLLNKICPENLKIIVERLAQIDLYTAGELEFVIKIIFGKALLEPTYCETYADMVFALRTRYPEFPPEQEGEKPHTFTRVLLNTCQNEFESLPTTFEATEDDKLKLNDVELNLELQKRKGKMLANMKFIGNLFLRHLLAVKVIGQVVHDLVGIKEGCTYPEEHMIECVCELLKAIGHTLDGTSHGKSLMDHFTSRLMDLRRNTHPDGSAIYSKRIVFRIQDLLDLRKNNWQQKLFKEQPTTKEDIKKSAQKEGKLAARGIDVTFATQTAGVRPTYIDEFKQPPKPRPVKEERKLSWDQPYVKRCFQYFLEDRNVDGLVAEWKRPDPTSDQKREAVGWLCDIGFNDSQKEEMVAETLVVLLSRGCISWSHLQDSLLPSIEDLENIQLDTPAAPKFAHSLFSKLFIEFKNNFQSSLLSVFRSCSNKGLVYSVLIGILKKVLAKAGNDGVKRVLNDQPEFVNLLLQCKGIQRDQLKAALAQEGL